MFFSLSSSKMWWCIILFSLAIYPGFIFAVEYGTLLDTAASFSKWTLYDKDGDGIGWDADETTKSFLTRSLYHRGQMNWLISPYIDLHGVGMVDLHLTVNFTSCHFDKLLFDNCRMSQTVKLLSQNQTSFTLLKNPSTLTDDFEAVAEVLPHDYDEATEVNIYDVATPMATTGMYVALVDYGTSVTLSKITIRHKYCSHEIHKLVIFEQSVPSLEPHTGRCADNAVSAAPVQRTCNSEGDWSPLREECKCRSRFVGVGNRCIAQKCTASTCKNGATCSENSGTFVCHCTEGYTGQMCESVLNSGPDEISIVFGHSSREGECVSEGQRVSFRCIASGGYEPISIEWSRDQHALNVGNKGNVVKQTDGTYVSVMESPTLTLSSQHHGSVMTCEAYNSFNIMTPLEANQTLQVCFGPKETDDIHIQHKVIADGIEDYVLVHCSLANVFSNSFKFEWKFNNNELPESAKQRDEGQRSLVEILKSELDKSIMSGNTADFSCAVKNLKVVGGETVSQYATYDKTVVADRHKSDKRWKVWVAVLVCVVGVALGIILVVYFVRKSRKKISDKPDVETENVPPS